MSFIHLPMSGPIAIPKMAKRTVRSMSKPAGVGSASVGLCNCEGCQFSGYLCHFASAEGRGTYVGLGCLRLCGQRYSSVRTMYLPADEVILR